MTDGNSNGQTRLGIIGVGGMGGAMAKRALKMGGHVVIHDVNASVVDELVALGAVSADSPAAVAEQVDVVSVVVVNDDQVREVVVPGHDVLWVIHSTVMPATIDEVSSRGDLIDAAVAGGEWAVEGGDLVVLVGGDEALLERARPALELFAGTIFHVGPLGFGVRAKIARNLLTLSEFTLGEEVRRLVDAVGIDAELFRKILVQTDRTIPVHGGLLLSEPYLPGQVVKVNNLVRIMRKDLLHAVELAESVGGQALIGSAAAASAELAIPFVPGAE
jgi:3-hydroxyisobutyrate dehydrogenase-like beta-hydroxyacid dehydrogenase